VTSSKLVVDDVSSALVFGVILGDDGGRDHVTGAGVDERGDVGNTGVEEGGNGSRCDDGRVTSNGGDGEGVPGVPGPGSAEGGEDALEASDGGDTVDVGDGRRRHHHGGGGHGDGGEEDDDLHGCG